MKSHLYTILLFMLFHLCVSGQTYDEGKLYLKFKGTEVLSAATIAELPASVVSILKKHAFTGWERAFAQLNVERLNNIYIVSFSTALDARLAMEEFNSLAEVEYVELVPLYEKSLIPNDPLLSQQWYIGSNYINAYTAWNLSVGSANVKLAIVDDAVRITHQDLSANVWVNPNEIPGNGIDDDNNGYVDDINGWDAGDNDNNPNPPLAATNSVFTHGTHCAGIAGASSNNNIGVASIGYGIKLISVKCNYNSNTGNYLNNTLGGVQYAIAARADVVSMSWGGMFYSQTYQLLFNYGHSLGITFVAAAGNSNSSQTFYPAGYNHVVSVAASDVGDVKAGFSNYGSWIDITAPGVRIYSTLAGSNSSYGNLSGTSMACPMVAGLCALIKSHNPLLNPDQIEQCLKDGADNINAVNPNFNGQLGAGRINALNALRCTPCVVNASFTTLPQQISNYPVGSNLSFSSSGNGITYRWYLNNLFQSSATTYNYTFNSTGFQTVSLIVTGNDSLCTDTFSRSFTVVDSIRNFCEPLHGANWFFGNTCRVSFATQPPTTSSGPLNTGEGSATISDECGNLLFFTDGVRVWDKSGQQMPNGFGLYGHNSAPQVAIVPKPGSTNLFYIFTVDYNGGSRGLNYSIVDLSLPGGGTIASPRGDVTVKNVFLRGGCSEKVTATKHANGVDYWILVHNSTNNDFYSFQLTANGVHTTPVTSTINDNHNINMTTGQLKFSPDGSRVAIAFYIASSYNFKIYNFNRWTGELSSFQTIAVAPVASAGAYGVEFSPDGTKLYLTTVDDQPKLVQYDINTGVQTVLVNEVKFPGVFYGLGQLQLGPDGKIYVARQGYSTLGVIHYPNLAGLNCGYCAGVCGSTNGLFLQSGTNSILGLPAFITAKNPPQDYAYSDACVNQLTTFHATDFFSCASENTYSWNFGDPTTGLRNFSSLRNPVHQFSRAGVYNVSLTVRNTCDTVTVSKQLTIICCSVPDNVNSRVKLCLGDTTQLAVTPTSAIVNWSPTLGLSSTTVYNPLCYTNISRTYFATVNDTSIGCSRIDTFYVEIRSQQPINITEGKRGCVEDTLRISGSYSAISWSNGATGAVNIVTSPGRYTVLAADTNGCVVADTVDVILSNLALQISGRDSICLGALTTLSVRDTFDTYLWSNLATDTSIVITTPGTYWVRVSKNICEQTDTFHVYLSTTGVSLTTSSVNSGCTSTGSATVIASEGNGNYSYLWSNGATTPTIANVSAGSYAVTVSSGSCTATSVVNVGTSGGVALSMNSVNTTCGASNGSVTATPIVGTLPVSFSWSNGSNNSSIGNLASGVYVVTVTDANGCSATASAIVNPSISSSVTTTADKTLICPNDTALICALHGFSSYLWNTGQTGQCIEVTLAGNYYVTATDINNCTAVSTPIAVNVLPTPSVSISVNGDTLKAFNGYSYQWYLNDAIIPGATSNVYIAQQSGNYMVQVTDSNGCRSSSTKVTVVTSVVSLGKESYFSIYPNPFAGNHFILEYSGDRAAILDVFDVQGRLVMQMGIDQTKSEVWIDAYSGVYLLRLSDGLNVWYGKAVKL